MASKGEEMVATTDITVADVPSDTVYTVADDAAERFEGIARWRAWATRHRAATAIIAGIVATHIATVFGFMETGIGLPKLDWLTGNGLFYLPKASPNVQFLTGALFHYTDGIVFAVLFACTVHPALARIGSSSAANIIKGLLFGTLLAIISAGYLFPHVYYPHVDVGLFAYKLGWKVPFCVFLWHWVWGLHLGAVYNVKTRTRA